MPVRVYAPDAVADGSAAVVLPRDEAAHVTRVLRLGVGAPLRVFDGRGHEWTAAVAAIARSTVSVALGDPVTPAAEPRVRYTMAVPALKGDGTDAIVRDVTMMGAAAVRPFVSTRAETTVAALVRGARADRWHRIAVASAKQCGRAVVPEVTSPVAWRTFAVEAGSALRLLCVEPAAVAAPVAIAEIPAPLAVTLAIGPEGGWAPEEIELALGAGWQPVQLGRRTLRAVAAPLVAMAACQSVWRDD